MEGFAVDSFSVFLAASRVVDLRNIDSFGRGFSEDEGRAWASLSLGRLVAFLSFSPLNAFLRNRFEIRDGLRVGRAWSVDALARVCRVGEFDTSESMF